MRQIYTVQYNGKEYDIEGDNPPTEQDMAGLIKPEAKPFIGDLMPEFSPNAKLEEPAAITPTDVVAGTVPLKGMRALTSGLADRFKETTGINKLSNQPIMKQTGLLPTNAVNIGANLGASQATPRNIASGAVDIMSSPETYAGIEALKPGMLSKPLQSLDMGISKATEPLQGLSKLPSFISGKGLPKQAEIVANELEDMRNLFGSAKSEDIAKVADIPIKNIGKLSQDLSDLGLSNETASRLKDPMYKIEFLGDGSVKPTVGNMDKVARALGDMLSPSEWDKFSNVAKSTIKRAYGMVRQSITETAPETKSSVDAFHYFLDNVYNPVNRKVIQGGRLVEKPLRDALAIGAENATKQAIAGGGEISPAMQKAIDYIKTYRKTIAGIKTAGASGILGGGGIIAKGLFK